MSYRGFTKAIGETSLERKCRWLFGACLLPLIAGSFWWYGQRQNDVMVEQFRYTGERLANAALVELHMTKQEDDPAMQRADEKLADELRSETYKWQILLPENTQRIGKPEDQFEWDLMEPLDRIGQRIDTRQGNRCLGNHSGNNALFPEIEFTATVETSRG